MFQFKDLSSIENGACFYNVDLHIHSYGGSHDVKDSSMTPVAIVDSAVRQGLKVIAITDHNHYVNVQCAIEYAQHKYAGQILVLAGVEVTTAHGHLLVYFSPERTEDLHKYLVLLNLFGPMGAENTRTAKSMADSITEAHKLGGICVAAHIDRDRTGFEAFAAGFQNWKMDIISSEGLYGLECDESSALCWYSETDEAGAAGAERKRILASRRIQPGTSSRPGLAHIQGSDAHTLEQFERREPSKPWTRVKLTDLTFDALMVAFIDPAARVRASASVPRTIPRVRGMAITGGFLDGVAIHFADNLNCLIGGRGTGKSTAIRALAYAFGLDEDFGDFGNCPDEVTVLCEDESGVRYRYDRTRGGDTLVKAKESDSITDVPIDSFRLEYFGQGELARVAEDPLKHPELFQAFLDHHTNLRDLVEKETGLVASLRENAVILEELEGLFGKLPDKKKLLEDTEKKLKIAEEGNLREIVVKQNKLASERVVRESVESIAKEYIVGFSLSSIHRSLDQILSIAGTCTDDEESLKTMGTIGSALLRSNAAVTEKGQELNRILKACGEELNIQAKQLKASDQRISSDVARALADLKASGVATDIPGLDALLKQKIAVAKEIANIERHDDELKRLRDERGKLREELAAVRGIMTTRRKAQLKGINENLATIIKDYTVFVKYDDKGITTEFEAFMGEKMHGTYLQDTTIESICNRVSPSELADFVLEGNFDEIVNRAEIGIEWAHKIVDKLCYWGILFKLQALAKQPKPVITVRTKSSPPKDIPVFQLSDGQRHTILLTVAMLADTNVPLVIDQPEDDLDNAFIFSSIVNTLRVIKEKRQVILVTHNANIAVLGDSELILPMHRENDCGKTKDRGSIDSASTKQCVLDILEGGSAAFLRRREMYRH